MRIFLAILFCTISVFAQSNPSDSTDYLHLYKWVQGANPGADQLNSNWDKIDSTIRKSNEFAKPELYAPYSDFIAVSMALQEAIDSSKIVLFSREYNISSKFNINLNSSDLRILGTPESKLVFTDTTSTGNIYHPDALFRITKGRNIYINGLTVEAVQNGKLPGLLFNSLSNNYDNDTANFLCAVKIDSCDLVTLENMTARKAIYAGFLISDVGKFFALNCNADSNLYAGMFVQRTDQSVILGGSYSYNGLGSDTSAYGTPYNFGYGVEFGNGFTTSLNQNAYVAGVKAYYNVRYGIGAHQLMNGVIEGNHIKGYGISALNFTNQGYEMYTKELILKNNIIEQDSSWWAANTAENHGVIPIQAGSYGAVNDLESYNFGSLIIQGNIIKNSTSYRGSTHYLDYFIHVWGSFARSIKILDNQIYNGISEYGIAVGSGGDQGGQPKQVEISGNHILNVTASQASDDNGSLILALVGKQIAIRDNVLLDCTASGTGFSAVKVFEFGTDSDISQADISGNVISGTYTNGIYVSSVSNLLTINNNQFNGSFSNRYFYVDPDVPFTALNNTTNDRGIATGSDISWSTASQRLPDYNTKSSGVAKYIVETNDTAPRVINTLTVDADEYAAGSAIFDITIRAAGANFANTSVYKYTAKAGNTESGGNPGTASYEVFSLSDYTINKASDIKPTVSWNSGTLQVSLPAQYTAYDIEINFNSWRLTPY